MAELSHLFSPITIGGCDIRNRIVITGHTTNYAECGLPSDTMLRYHEARAKGGAGLIISEIVAVNAQAKSTNHVVEGWRDEIIPWYRKISSAIHAHGAKVFCQVWHSGHQSSAFFNEVFAESCSPIPSAGIGEVPAVMTIDDIKRSVAEYVATARRLKEGGIDGIELHFGHGYLAQNFLSPLTNLRADEYGGSLENRMRYSLEVLGAVRDAVGREFVVGIRTSADELVAGGLTLDDMKEIIPIWAETGLIDYVNVSAGTYRSLAPTLGPMMIPPRPFVYLASEIRQLVDLPVFTAIRINDPVMANDIIANHEADMVGMARATICDPDMPNKAKAGKYDDIRQCIACNQGCLERLEHGMPITCMQNPETGHEGVYQLTSASTPKKVVVVGGGLAGTSAARAARIRGHEVVLYERGEALGGTILIPAKLPARQELGQAVRFLAHELARVGVKVNLGAEATATTVLAENPDAVIVATGATTVRDTSAASVGMDAAIEVEEGAMVASAEDVIERKVEVGQKVVVADFQNYMKGYVTAEYLADQGKDVTLVMPVPFRLFDANPYCIDKCTHGIQLFNMTLKNIKRIGEHEVKKVSPTSVTIRNVFTGEDEELEADTLVTSYWRSADCHLYEQLQGKVKELYKIGDCLAPRRTLNAVHEGYKVGMEV